MARTRRTARKSTGRLPCVWRERRLRSSWRVAPGDSGARWAPAGCGRARQCGATVTRGPGSTVPDGANSNWIKKYFKRIQICLNFDRSERCLTLLRKLEIKYGWKEIEIRNNFAYGNLSIFEFKFEWKVKELFMCWNRRKFTGKFWNFGFQQNLASKLLVTPYCKEKLISIKRGSESWIPLKMGIRLISW
jgi:hypothetical protein